ncbi:MAG: 2-polyprenyl-6-methoxyphenol hydroxylase-like FAD-dependent oxidoreductase [Oleispira sp.]|jgi:2-polyprenyl-6-methoxyphenol hydroxylase-like FAD-dependent oxidoreductase
MKIIIIGGGPAGLYFANAMKIFNPNFDITVYEAKNESINSFGLGYTLQGLTKDLLANLDEDYFTSLFANNSPPRLSQAIVKTNRDCKTFNFSDGHCVSRFELMRYLRNKATSLGITIEEKKVLPSELRELQDTCDLLVGADGVNSIVRKQYAAKFVTHEEKVKIRFAWFYNDSPKPQKDVRFYVFKTSSGFIQLSSYPLTDTRQAVIIEMTEKCFQSSSFHQQSPADAMPYLNKIFTSNEDKIDLIPSNLPWFSFKMNTVKHLFHENVALIGDAAFSFHYSAGVGLQTAFNMGYALTKCFQSCSDINTILNHYSKMTPIALRASIDKSLDDINWLENIDKHLLSTPEHQVIKHYLQKNKYSKTAPSSSQY